MPFPRNTIQRACTNIFCNALKLEERLHFHVLLEKKDLKTDVGVTRSTVGIVRTARLLLSTTDLERTCVAVYQLHTFVLRFVYITASACQLCKNKK